MILYRGRSKKLRTCVLCDRQIRTTYKLCHECFKEYSEFVQEPWFKEIARLQAQQDKIDKFENTDLDAPAAQLIGDTPNITIKKDIGRPKTDWRIVNKVLEIYDRDREQVLNGEKKKPLSLRAMAREINEAVGYFTVRSILIQYRPDYNKKKI